MKTRRKPEVSMDVKMKEGDAFGHANSGFWRNEAKAAAYLGFSDVSDFRRFRFHHVVLKWYHVHADNSQKRRSAAPLRLIRDINDVDQFFPADIDQLTEKHLINATQDNETRSNNQDHIYATVLFRLSEDIAAMSVSPRTNTMQQEKASNRFESHV